MLTSMASSRSRGTHSLLAQTQKKAGNEKERGVPLKHLPKNINGSGMLLILKGCVHLEIDVSIRFFRLGSRVQRKNIQGLLQQNVRISYNPVFRKMI